MDKIQTILKIGMLIMFVFSSGCSQTKAVISPTSTSQPTQKPTTTTSPSPTITLEPIAPKGILIYSDYKTVYLIDLQNLKTKSVFSTDGLMRTFVSKDYIYIANQTSLESIDAKFEAFRLNLDGTHLEQFEIADESRFSPYQIISVSPNDRYIAYYKPGKIIIVDTSSKTTQSINEPPSHGFLSAFWSFDSNRIFIVDMAFHNSIGEHMRLLQYSMDSKETTELLSDFPNPEFEWHLEGDVWNWSPDGRYLLINYAGLYLFDIEKKSLEKVKVNGTATGFTWSLNGKRLLFHEIETQEQREAYILDVENGGMVEVSEFMPTQYNCAWSPNGSMMLCESAEKHLYLIDSNKKASRDIASVGGLEYSGRGGTWLSWFFHPTWSPDSQYFSYLTMSNPDPTAYEQDFILNIQSVETGGYLQIQIPREKEIEQIHWR